MWVLLKHQELDQARYGATLDTINAAIYKALLLVVAIVVVKLVWETVQRSVAEYKSRLAAR